MEKKLKPAGAQNRQCVPFPFSVFFPSFQCFLTMHSGLIWCVLYNSDGVEVRGEDLFPVDSDTWGDDIEAVTNVVYEHLSKHLPDGESWQFEIGGDAFSGVLDYYLENPVPTIPPCAFTLRDASYSIHFPATKDSMEEAYARLEEFRATIGS
jgi:hypothetical protein